MNQNNSTTNVGTTDPNTGAVYTSGTNLQQGVGQAAGAVYTSGVSTSGVNTSSLTSNVTTGSVGSMGTNTGTSNVQQIKQQLQNLQTQLRQSQTTGTVNEAYTDAANRLQDVFEILNNSK